MVIVFSIIKKGNGLWLLLFLLIIAGRGIAQTNLVENPGFEVYTTCPSTFGNYAPAPWYIASKNLDCYANSCSMCYCSSVPNNYYFGNSYQYTHNGEGYICLFYMFTIGSNYRMYIQTKLTDSLQAGKRYIATYYVNVPNSFKYGFNNAGMLFTKPPVYSDTIQNTYGWGIIETTPQVMNYGNPVISDTLNWVKVSGIYTATGGEQYITIGNFKKDANTSFVQIQPAGAVAAGFYIDDVSVIPLDSFCLKADAGKDTTINANDSVFIGSYTNGIDSIKWYNSSGQLIDSLRPGFWVHPATTGTYMYIIEQTVNGCYSRDTVFVNVVVPLRFTMYNVRGTNGDCGSSLRGTKQSVGNIWQTANEINVLYFNIQRSTNGKDFLTIGQVKANNKNSNEYLFTDAQLPLTTDPLTIYYRIEAIDKDGKKTFSTIQQITTKPQTPNNVFIFPNPAKGFVNIECKDGIKEVKLFDITGSEIAHFVPNDGNKTSYTVHLTLYTNGAYMVQVILSNGNIVNQKLVIQ